MQRTSIASDDGVDKVTVSTSGLKKMLDVSADVANKPTDAYSFSDGDESDVTYDYYLFLKDDGGWYILRLTKNGLTGRYATGISGSTAAWAVKASQTYDTYDVTF